VCTGIACGSKEDYVNQEVNEYKANNCTDDKTDECPDYSPSKLLEVFEEGHFLFFFLFQGRIIFGLIFRRHFLFS
jgi:hypothetical protein